ncbi:uncharacterized protein LOC128746308 [Sabethes cyaneus]|uniref:uncharacterized protein LOC128746308 n=1 Tax=Sabethes cyaneus TaxID=53552 RepID=UPI00237DE1E3|nr:uncharacterized protein LOC128746308 [Sabethes cyaneus]
MTNSKTKVNTQSKIMSETKSKTQSKTKSKIKSRQKLRSSPRPTPRLGPTPSHSSPELSHGSSAVDGLNGGGDTLAPSAVADVAVEEHCYPPSATVDTLPKSDCIRLYYQNVRGLRTKVDDFFISASDAEFDVVILTETWLNDRFHSPQLFGTEYNVYRNDRDPLGSGKLRSGGVLIAVSKRYSSSESAVVDDREIEQLWVNVNGGNRTICLGVVYIPPVFSTSLKCVERHIDSAFTLSEKLGPLDFHLLFGDYNQPGLRWNCPASGKVRIDQTNSVFTAANSALVDGMALLDMQQINPFTNDRDRALDLVFANVNAVNQCDVIQPPEAIIKIDPLHPPILVTLSCPPLIRYEEVLDEREFDFYRTDFSGLNEALHSTDWSFLGGVDVNMAVSLFNQLLLSFFRDFVPRPRPKRKPPWSNSWLRRLKRKRSAALKKYSRLRNEITKQEFVRARRRYRTHNRHLYSRYVLQKQQHLKLNPKRFWSFVNEKRKETGLPAQMSLGDLSASNTEDICNLFAQQFSSVFVSSSTSALDVQEALKFVPANVCDINITSFTQNEVEAALKQLKSSVSPGPDGIPSIILKNCASTLSKPLQFIINQSLLQEKFPPASESSKHVNSCLLTHVPVAEDSAGPTVRNRLLFSMIVRCNPELDRIGGSCQPILKTLDIELLTTGYKRSYLFLNRC